MSPRKAKAVPKEVTSAVLGYVLKGAVLGFLEQKGSDDGSMAVSVTADDLGLVGIHEELALSDFMLVQAGYMKIREGDWTVETPAVHKAIEEYLDGLRP